MATKTHREPLEPGAQTTRRDRLRRAWSLAGGQIVEPAWSRLRDVDLSLKQMQELVKLAEKLGCDPRWLAVGQPSAAALAAIGALDRGRARRLILSVEHVRAAVEILQLMPQPDCGFAGTCRYCFCTDEQGCGDCQWVDAACTICSSCLVDEH